MSRPGVEIHWHAGEHEIHNFLRIPQRDNPTYPGLGPHYYKRIIDSPLVAFGTLDQQGRPWTTIWGGEAGFCRPIAQGFIGTNTEADARFDPVFQELFAATDDESLDRKIVDERVIKPEGGKPMAALTIDLETRDRVKLSGRFVAGAVTSRTDAGLGAFQMALQVEESLGNCPKYLNKKHITPHSPRPVLLSEGSGLPLPLEAVDLLAQADLFFISSKHGDENMDVNHRGGPPGFMRLFRNSANEVTLVYPEYSGNRLYQTLGNLQKDPVAGIVVPDFQTGNVLYLTGRTTTLFGDKAAAYLPRTKLAVKIEIDEARFVQDGLPFRGDVIDYSPYNPPVRRLLTEQDPVGAGDAGSDAMATATLKSRDLITPTIARFVFKLHMNSAAPSNGTSGIKEEGKQQWWLPGQHVTLDFGPELDRGWSHMNDGDPQSLNDDFVRTFTVSAPHSGNDKDPEMQITARKHGPATGLLWRWNLRVPLELPVLGFGGGEGFRLPIEVIQNAGANDDAAATQSIFVAGGVGITPLMAQAKAVLQSGVGDLRVIWSLRAEDLPLAIRVFEEIEGLGPATTLFVTGTATTEETRGWADTLKGAGAVVVQRRLSAEDLLGVGEKGRRTYYCCTGTALMTNLSSWLKGEKMVYESFNY
ncbi:hypothetical protein PFICI_10267 [Pestalotiopsis fici W106-1]|uniref:FAD-binding FR-type domain-containing protein n=1 Tax=Pestalotiopsis fici (strain W106-1 / CGMCC3.15140) TaxID=1229662 RepID=W3WWH7_PESFW|nr:uncharacterized protein PFICI_10267 [Pestalotiopsis fici W106-1]ETS78205.1 hypothetical protein PFICI_10267 [Pestalotiopsis fici W106-1]